MHIVVLLSEVPYSYGAKLPDVIGCETAAHHRRDQRTGTAALPIRVHIRFYKLLHYLEEPCNTKATGRRYLELFQNSTMCR